MSPVFDRMAAWTTRSHAYLLPTYDKVVLSYPQVNFSSADAHPYDEHPDPFWAWCSTRSTSGCGSAPWEPGRSRSRCACPPPWTAPVARRSGSSPAPRGLRQAQPRLHRGWAPPAAGRPLAAPGRAGRRRGRVPREHPVLTRRLEDEPVTGDERPGRRQGKAGEYPPSGLTRASRAAVPMWSTAVVGSSSTGAGSRASSTAVGRHAPGVSSAVPRGTSDSSHGPEVERDAGGHRADGVVRALERLRPAHPHPAAGHLQLVVDADRPLLEGCR